MATSYDRAVSTHPNVVVSPSLSDEIVCINYYTLSGIRILKPIDGIYIKEVIYKNGEKQRSKVCIRHF